MNGTGTKRFLAAALLALAIVGDSRAQDAPSPPGNSWAPVSPAGPAAPARSPAQDQALPKEPGAAPPPTQPMAPSAPPDLVAPAQPVAPASPGGQVCAKSDFEAVVDD